MDSLLHSHLSLQENLRVRMSRGDELAQVGDIFLFASTWLALALVVCSGVQGRLIDNAPRASDVQASQC